MSASSTGSGTVRVLNVDAQRVARYGHLIQQVARLCDGYASLHVAPGDFFAGCAAMGATRFFAGRSATNRPSVQVGKNIDAPGGSVYVWITADNAADDTVEFPPAEGQIEHPFTVVMRMDAYTDTEEETDGRPE